MDSPPTSNTAVWATAAALLNLATTFLMAIVVASMMGWLMLAAFVVMLMAGLALSAVAIAEWVKYFRGYVDHAVRRGATTSA